MKFVMKKWRGREYIFVYLFNTFSYGVMYIVLIIFEMTMKCLHYTICFCWISSLNKISRLQFFTRLYFKYIAYLISECKSQYKVILRNLRKCSKKTKISPTTGMLNYTYFFNRPAMFIYAIFNSTYLRQYVTKMNM